MGRWEGTWKPADFNRHCLLRSVCALVFSSDQPPHKVGGQLNSMTLDWTNWSNWTTCTGFKLRVREVCESAWCTLQTHIIDCFCTSDGVYHREPHSSWPGGATALCTDMVFTQARDNPCAHTAQCRTQHCDSCHRTSCRIDQCTRIQTFSATSLMTRRKLHEDSNTHIRDVYKMYTRVSVYKSFIGREPRVYPHLQLLQPGISILLNILRDCSLRTAVTVDEHA